ncbi:MAG: response regulator [Ramlibacter sp.]|nr:response regulator [Ramlibacter sp.]
MTARILVIEDNAANMELACYVLQKFGYSTVAAVDGESGVDKALAEPPDLIVCDLQLPGIDGFEVLRRLRDHDATRRLPVLAVTAYAMVGDRERVLAAGFNGYLPKPIDPQEFVQRVATMLGQGVPLRLRPAEPAKDHPAHAPAARAQALVLDDSKVNLDLLRSLLEPHGIAVTAVSTTQEAFAELERHVPDLIISDIHIGRERGEDFYNQVRRMSRLRDTPFMFITSTLPREMRRLAQIATGADRFVVRPIDNARLLEEIEGCLAAPRAS